MKREREIKMLRNKRKLMKKYSDFELGLLASEINDYTYLLKSIQFPIDTYKISESKKENDEKENEKEKEKEVSKNNNKYVIQKIISLNEINEEDNEDNNKESDEEYNGLRVKEKNKINKKKRK